MKNRVFPAVLVCWMGWGAATQAQESGSLPLVSKRDHTLAIVDPASLKANGTAPVGEDGLCIMFSSDALPRIP